jgi:hypothetical protein
MNWVAWALSGLLLLVILRDLVRVEKDRRSGGR